MQVILIATGVGARSINEVLGDGATEEIMRRQPPTRAVQAKAMVVDEAPQAVESAVPVEEVDPFSNWPFEGPQRAMPHRDSLEVPAFLRKRIRTSTYRMSDADLTA